MEMINDKMKMIKEKVDFYLKKQIKVHIIKNDKSWMNGFILYEEVENVYVFDEVKDGKVYLFLSDIYEIEDYKREVKE
jgi:hypothetical protein